MAELNSTEREGCARIDGGILSAGSRESLCLSEGSAVDLGGAFTNKFYYELLAVLDIKARASSGNQLVGLMSSVNKLCCSLYLYASWLATTGCTDGELGSSPHHVQELILPPTVSGCVTLANACDRQKVYWSEGCR